MAAPHPTPSPLFDGPALGELLAARTARAVTAAQRFDRSVDASAEAAARIIADTDLTSAGVTWDAPQVSHLATDDQYMQSIVRWPVRGNVSALTWMPTRGAMTRMSVTAGLHGRTVAALIEGRHVTASDVISAQRRVRQYVDRHLIYIDDELTAWRAEMGRRVRDAVKARRALLAEVEALSASTSLEAVAP